MKRVYGVNEGTYNMMTLLGSAPNAFAAKEKYHLHFMSDEECERYAKLCDMIEKDGVSIYFKEKIEYYEKAKAMDNLSKFAKLKCDLALETSKDAKNIEEFRKERFPKTKNEWKENILKVMDFNEKNVEEKYIDVSTISDAELLVKTLPADWTISFEDYLEEASKRMDIPDRGHYTSLGSGSRMARQHQYE